MGNREHAVNNRTTQVPEQDKEAKFRKLIPTEEEPNKYLTLSSKKNNECHEERQFRVAMI